VPEREAAAGGSPEELDGPQALMKPRADGGEPGEPERGGENRAAPPRGAENDRAAPPRGPGDDRAAPPRGAARAETARPKNFPHRIWAACDFEARLPDYGWFGPPEKKNIPAYPGNATALGVGE
jgi:hypothetical protein